MKAVWGNRVSGIKDAGFNTLVLGIFYTRSHSEQAEMLEAAARDSIGIIPILHTYFRDKNISGGVALVNAWKSHPAIVGWFLLDEPQLNRIPVAEQRQFYNAIKSADPSHPLYTCWMADPKSGEYYAADVCDIHMVDYYPIIKGYPDWRALIRNHLDAWINSTGNRDIIPILQGFSRVYPHAEYLDPSGTIAEQFGFWKERGMTGRGYSFYQWETTNGDGIMENPRVLAEITAFNKGTGPPVYPCPYCPATFLTQAELDAHVAAEHPTEDAEIDVGDAAIDRPDNLRSGNTYIAKGNPANASGLLTKIAIYVTDTLVSCKVALFYVVSGGIKCRSVYTLPGTYAPGYHTIAVNIPVNAGDYIGLYFTSGRLDCHTDTGVGMWYTAGDKCVAGSQTAYTSVSARSQSLYGTGIVKEIITTKTVLHTCNAKISYQVSSLANNNNPLSCPHCGLSLGVEGIKGSQEIVEVPEVITPHIVTCPKCHSKLELSISSFANKNTQQYCPVCGQAAD